MALVPHASSTGKEESRGAIVAVRGAQELTQEEYEQRIKDAEVLEEKLKFITEKIPTRIMNVAGSNAGAGSGEFHMYRQARRREVMRQQRIEEEAVADAAEREYQEKKDKLAREEEERTAKRRAKRQKKKHKTGTAGASIGIGHSLAAAKAAENSGDEGLEQADLD